MQGFLSKLGLTRSYLCLNAFSYALIPTQAAQGDGVLTQPAQLAWRNALFDQVRSPSIQAVVAFGAQAQRAVNLWTGKSTLPVFNIPHPSSRDEAVLLKAWADAIVKLRTFATPDPDGNPALPNYGAKFLESDYASIPRRDLPFGVPSFLGDDSVGRSSAPPVRSSVTRPSPDDRHKLVWVAPKLT